MKELKRMTEELECTLVDRGLTFMSCADLEVLPSQICMGFPVGICLGKRLNPAIISEITRGPTVAYAHEYRTVNRLLDDLSERCANYLRAKGFRAIPFRASKYIKTDNTLSTDLPHKTVATLAGVGWIGKCALLITEKYGSAVRYNTVLTDAPLSVGSPVSESQCGDCTECMKACPAGAPNGTGWFSGRPRHEFYDAHACRAMAYSLSKKTGIEHPICGICIAVCPYSKSYYQRSAGYNISPSHTPRISGHAHPEDLLS